MRPLSKERSKNSFTTRISPYVSQQLSFALNARQHGSVADEFEHLENAHVLGQSSTYHHTRVHLMMLLWGFRQRDLKEIRGQIVRTIGAVTKTCLGWIPTGNTGGSNISPFKPLPIAPELAEKISAARA